MGRLRNPASGHGPSFVVYVDESGDEGFKFDNGSSEWFVLAGAVTRKKDDVDTVKLVDNVRTTLKRDPKKPLHFRDLRHEHRIPFLDEIARSEVRLIAVLVHKPSLRGARLPPHELYFSGVRQLLEKVSWYCRDAITATDGGDGTAHIVLSNRSDLSTMRILQYLEGLKRRPGAWLYAEEWDVIIPSQFTAFSPGRQRGLQIADAVASGLFFGLERNAFGFSEDRYARMLRRSFYNRSGAYLDFGISFMPTLGTMLLSDERLGWVRELR